MFNLWSTFELTAKQNNERKNAEPQAIREENRLNLCQKRESKMSENNFKCKHILNQTYFKSNKNLYSGESNPTYRIYLSRVLKYIV